MPILHRSSSDRRRREEAKEEEQKRQFFEEDEPQERIDRALAYRQFREDVVYVNELIRLATLAHPQYSREAIDDVARNAFNDSGEANNLKKRAADAQSKNDTKMVCAVLVAVPFLMLVFWCMLALQDSLWVGYRRG